MINKIAIACLCLPLATTSMAQTRQHATPPAYPSAQRSAVVDDYFGTRVPAPYRWMEQLQNPQLQRWVDQENALTQSWLRQSPVIHQWFKSHLGALWNYARESVPDQAGGRLFFTRNSGLQNQDEIFEQAGTAPPRRVIDPNALSPDGSVALLNYVPSPDGRYLAYSLSQGGSDWKSIHVRDVASGKDLPDVMRWVKFSYIAWTHDDRGIFYSRYREPAPGSAITDKVEHQALYFHLLGTPQAADRKVYVRPDLPQMVINASVSEDGHYLFIYLKASSSKNELYYLDLKDPAKPRLDGNIVPLSTRNDAKYDVIGNVGNVVFMHTTYRSPNGHIVSFDLSDPSPAHWHAVVAQAKYPISTAVMADGHVVVQYLADAQSRVDVYARDGKLVGKLPLPGISSVSGLSARNDSPLIYYGVMSYLHPLTIYRYNLATGKRLLFFKPNIPFDPSRYQTRQVFYRSKDGTRIPMFITARKGVRLDGSNPTILYGYGGFGVNVTPRFRPIVPAWLELGGVYVVANLRGGGEYGETWHQAGKLGNKQNVFDDFAYAAKYLIREHYTSTPRLGIWGYSNGGLLVGASVTQRPRLFGAAYAGSGVLDMLRYQKFSGGALWAHEYGTSADPKAFKWLYAYSPVQNVRPGTCYPPTLLTTADHDDRVVPSHSYKFAAALQHVQACANPILIRVARNTSHGYMPTDKRITQAADIWTFMARELKVAVPPSGGK